MPKEPLIVIAPPQRLPQLQGRGVTIAHQAYRIGKGPHLYRSGAAVPLRGGLMALDSGRAEGTLVPEVLCEEILRECAARNFQGVLCDFAQGTDPFLERLLRELSERLARRGWKLYLPEWYAYCTQQGHVMISSAISGGSFRTRLETARERYGARRAVLALQRVAEDFFLPAPGGSGTPLSRAQLRELIGRLEPSVFFSGELCARYFTYMNGVNDVHFVLFDDMDTFQKKLQIAQELGFGGAVAAYDEVEERLEQFLRLLR